METIWIEIDGSEMMATDFAVFLEFLSINDMKYASYHGEDEKMIIEIQGDIADDFDEMLSQFTYYHPIVQLEKEPEVSDIDLIEEMSNID